MSTVKLSTVLSALSYALDLTEGQPLGHAARSCLIGMRIAEQLQLPDDQRSDLFYALLMKDVGCSSNAARIYQLFGGDEQPIKRGLWLRDWRSWREKVAFAFEWAERGGTPPRRLWRIATLALAGPGGERDAFAIRCDRGAHIARMLGVSEATAVAIHAMDEHWDGGVIPIACGARISRCPPASSAWRRWRKSTGASEVLMRRSKWRAPVAAGGSTPISCRRSAVSARTIVSGRTWRPRTSTT